MEAKVFFKDRTELQFDDVVSLDINFHGHYKIVHKGGYEIFPRGDINRICMEKEEGD